MSRRGSVSVLTPLGFVRTQEFFIQSPVSEIRFSPPLQSFQLGLYVKGPGGDSDH
jgi:hypothetical protein